jgi:hypothetical protein
VCTGIKWFKKWHGYRSTWSVVLTCLLVQVLGLKLR